MTKKKTLLEEGTVRQFMKLANLKPLASDFVESLYEKKEGDNARLATALGAKKDDEEDDDTEQSEKDREHESEGEEEAQGKPKYSGNKSSSQTDEGLMGKIGGGLAGLASPIPGGAMLGAAAGDAAQDALTGNRDEEEFEVEGEVEEEGGEVDIHRLVSAITTAIENETGVEISVSEDEEMDLGDEGEYDEHELENAEADEEHADALEDDAEEDLGDLEEVVTTVAENVQRRLRAIASKKQRIAKRK